MAEKREASAAPAETKKARADESRRIAQFVGPGGELLGEQVEVPLSSTREQLEQLVGQLRQDDERVPYSLHVGSAQVEVTEALADAMKNLEKQEQSGERVLQIAYFPMAVFRVRPVTRCSSSMPGHTEAVLCAAFSPDSKLLATGSGDTSVRIWDLGTEMPMKELRGHKEWVLQVAWSPDGRALASAGTDKTAVLWDPKSGSQLATLKGHTQAVTALAWQPLHLADSPMVATGSKDNSIRVWDCRGVCVKVLSSHTGPVMVLRWGGGGGTDHPDGVLYSASRDRLVKVWSPDGRLLQDLKGHAHWVNTLALSTDYVLQTGCYDHTRKSDQFKDDFEKNEKVCSGKVPEGP
jgi:ribosome assembly protein 4